MGIEILFFERVRNLRKRRRAIDKKKFQVTISPRLGHYLAVASYYVAAARHYLAAARHYLTAAS